MEAGGLAVGIIALAGLFNNAVDCFEYVQLGRAFGNNFQTSLLKLDNARLQLSRWGQAVGLSGEIEDISSLQGTTIKEEDIAQAEKLLGQLLKLFADAEGISTRYKHSLRPDDPNLTALDVHTDMDALGQTLHEKMRKLCIKRQNGTKLRQKVKWALYEETQFKKLIEDIVGLVSNLQNVFPAAKQQQLKLCEAEISEIGADSLSVLREIVQSQDKDLEAAISAAMKSSKQGTQFNNYNNKVVNQGEKITIQGGQQITM